MIICFDWDGTIAKPDVAKEASTRRLKTLGKDIDKQWLAQAMKNNDHYALNKKLIAEYTGVNSPTELTIIMTDLFRIHYLAVVHEWKDDALYPEMPDIIKKLCDTGHRLAIVSTLRKDILEYSLENLDLNYCFEEIYANTPDLKYSKEDLARMAKKHFDEIDFFIGDKEEDILAGKSVGAKTIYVTWGATGNEHDGKADYTTTQPENLTIIFDTKK
jgi:phosphoglycolate phosphatase-like HAD superfamily hydrolase